MLFGQGGHRNIFARRVPHGERRVETLECSSYVTVQVFSRSNPPAIPRQYHNEKKVFQEEEHPPFVADEGPGHGCTLRKTGINIQNGE